jgi:hypothetical protein
MSTRVMGTQRSASLREGLGGHVWALQGVYGVRLVLVVLLVVMFSVLREDNRETVCGRQEFTEVGQRACTVTTLNSSQLV